MSAQIINAAPMVIDLGTQDLSTRQLPLVPVQIPQHLPKFYIYGQKGPTTPQLVVGASRDAVFGTDTFNLRKKWANHATVFANAANAEGNICMLQRLIPADAGPAANMLLSLDVLPTTVDLYARNADGSIQTDAAGSPVVTGSATGFKVKWVLSHATTNTTFGTAVAAPGDQVDSATGTQSTRYPIFEFQISSQGDYGNNRGIRLWAPTTLTDKNMPTSMMSTERAYPLYLQVVQRADANSSASVVQTVFGDQKVMSVLKPNALDPISDSPISIGENFINSYQNINDPRYPTVYGDFGKMALYQQNIDTVLAEFQAAEIPYSDSNTDFGPSATDMYLFNFVTGMNSNGAPYNTFQLVDDSSSVRLSAYANIWASGGSDGTMSNALFADLVSTEVKRYLDPNDPVQDMAVNVESIFYDSGFPLQTKYDLCSVIANRKDTFLVLSTHDVDGPVLSASEEYSLAIALRTRLQMYPESDYFGSQVMRGMILGRSARVRGSQYTGRLPLGYEIIVKSARYMGAGNGRWKNGFNFDGAPGSVLSTMYDVSITFVPASVRNRNWDVGLNWVQSYDTVSFFFPALKTVYNDDTSVLNSYFTAMAIAQLNKVAHSAWREFSGVSGLTNGQLVQRVNEFVNERIKDRFDGRFVIIPAAEFTDMDLLRGYSWTLPIEIYAPNMETVMTTYVQAYRISDYNPTAA